MEVQEHFYADDPARGPADGKTTLRNVDYFFLGNGLVQAAVQIAPSGEATPVGLLIMDPERLGPKRAAVTFDKNTGIAATGLSLAARGMIHAARPGTARARWLPGTIDPRVEVVWRSGPYRVTELFFCPDTRTGRLLRRISVSRSAGGASKIRAMTGIRDRTIETELAFKGRAAGPVVFEYSFAERDGEPSLRLRLGSDPGAAVPAIEYWRGTADCRFSDPLLDRFFAASKFQLRAAVSRSGRLDGSIWQYNLEWVRDQAFIAMALAMSGQFGARPDDPRPPPLRFRQRRGRDHGLEPAPPLGRERVRPERRSPLRPRILSQLDRGQRASSTRTGTKIERAAAFPLRPQFRHGPSGLHRQPAGVLGTA